MASPESKPSQSTHGGDEWTMVDFRVSEVGCHSGGRQAGRQAIVSADVQYRLPVEYRQ